MMNKPGTWLALTVGCLSATMIKKSCSFFLQSLKACSRNNLTGKILGVDFYPKAVYFECKVWISRSATNRLELRWLDLAKSDVICSLA